jgi:hypothetical protein
VSANACITLRQGSLFLSREICDLYFRGLEGVVLLRQDVDLLVLPVRHLAAGGYFLKLRNARGDCVVTAPDFFREHGADYALERLLRVRWDSSRSALIAALAFDLTT